MLFRSPEFLSGVLDAVSPLTEDLIKNQAAVGEAVDFLGEARYGPAVDFLYGIVHHRDASPTMVQAAIGSLGLIATGDAEAVLSRLAKSPRLDLSQAAGQALETVVRERSLLAGLDRYGVEISTP